ncbi:MAG: acylphosphatase [Candidatus Omnitrophota bacterium]
MDESQRVHVVYGGNVHGVGFRFAAERIATRLELTGFARNLPDGTVEVVCEGEQNRLAAFLDDMEKAMVGYIGSSRVEWEAPRAEFSSFEIRM